MPDIVDKATRSRMMAGIQGKNTRPEVLVRRQLHARGFRFRLYDRKLPGRPDIVLPKYRAVILVNGCFWHGHDCHLFKWPSTRQDWWHAKILRTREVDARNLSQLENLGWRVAEVWECAIKGRTRIPHEEIADQLEEWLRSGSTDRLQVRGTDRPDGA